MASKALFRQAHVLRAPSAAISNSSSSAKSAVPVAARALSTRTLLPSSSSSSSAARTTTSASRKSHPLQVQAQQSRSLQSSSGGGSQGAWASQGDVTYDELKPLTQQPTGEVTLIDVREREEVAQGHIPSSVNVPLSEFATAFDPRKESDFEAKYSFRRPAYGDKIIVHCRSGKRSAEAQEFARKMGWKEVRNYKGSWLDWTEREGKGGAQ